MKRLSQRTLSASQHFPHVDHALFLQALPSSGDRLADLVSLYHKLPQFSAKEFGFAADIKYEPKYRADILMLALALWNVPCARLEGAAIHPEFCITGKITAAPGSSVCLEVHLHEPLYVCTRVSPQIPDCYRPRLTKDDAHPDQPARSDMFLQIIDPHVRHDERIVWKEQDDPKNSEQYFAEDRSYILKI